MIENHGPYELEQNEKELSQSTFNFGLGSFASNAISLPTNLARGTGTAGGGVLFAGGNVVQDASNAVGVGGVTASVGQVTSASIRGAGDAGEAQLGFAEGSAQLAGETADNVVEGGFKLFSGLFGWLAAGAIGLVVFIIIIIIIISVSSRSGGQQQAAAPAAPASNPTETASEIVKKLKNGNVDGAKATGLKALGELAKTKK